MRPAQGAFPANVKAVKFFIPWSLSHTLGEWNFRRDNRNPNVVLDEHWWMTPDYTTRETYKDVPTPNLIGTGLTADHYSVGELEDWVPAALTLPRGKVLSAELKIPASDTTPKGFVLEVYAKVKPGARGPFISSEDPAGFVLSFTGAGALRFSFGGVNVDCAEDVAVDQLKHIFVEYDGGEKILRIYVDGKLAGSAPCEKPPTFETETVIVVGGVLEATYEFLRVGLASLAQSYTTIDELRAWQTNGPHLHDFTGKPFSANRPSGAMDY